MLGRGLATWRNPSVRGSNCFASTSNLQPFRSLQPSLNLLGFPGQTQSLVSVGPCLGYTWSVYLITVRRRLGTSWARVSSSSAFCVRYHYMQWSGQPWVAASSLSTCFRHRIASLSFLGNPDIRDHCYQASLSLQVNGTNTILRLPLLSTWARNLSTRSRTSNFIRPGIIPRPRAASESAVLLRDPRFFEIPLRLCARPALKTQRVWSWECQAYPGIFGPAVGTMRRLK